MNAFIKSFLSFFFLFAAPEGHEEIQTKTQNLEDQRRNRIIPIQKYEHLSPNTSLPLVIINHGYGCLNTEYAFLGEHLAQKGYLVISIQHDLNNDPPLPRTGNLFDRRLPFWKRGVENILYIMSQIHSNKVILIGHSNGGDISMLFATQHPDKVDKVISLDSLRYPFPTQNNIPILSLRANDTKADEGVIPPSGATIINIENAKHIDMCDRGPEAVKSKIISCVNDFLNEDTH